MIEFICGAVLGIALYDFALAVRNEKKKNETIELSRTERELRMEDILYKIHEMLQRRRR